MSRKYLGQLTLDIVARTGGFLQGMDKAERASEKWRKQVERDAKVVGSTIGKSLVAGVAAATAAVAATAALTKKGLEAVTAQADLAESLNTTYDSITALKMAASDANLDGLEGSITRLNRRLGAAERGAGAAASAVKALNLDLDALSKMDAAERVATIADAIKDSGASMQATARYAQDLGFEQKEAAKFFAQGGDALREYTKQVDEFGLSLTEIDAAKVQAATTEFGKTGRVVDGVSQQLAVQLSPLLLQISKDITDLSRETGGFADEIEDLTDKAVRAAAFVASSIDAVGVVASTVAKSFVLVSMQMQRPMWWLADAIINGPTSALNELIETANRVPGVDIEPVGLSGLGQKIRSELSLLTGAIEIAKQDIQDGLLDPLAGEKLINYYEDAKVAAQEAAQAAVDLKEVNRGAGSVLEDPAAIKAREAAAKAAAAAEKDRLEGIAKEITALERAAATWGMSANEVKLYDMTVQGATDAQLIHAQAIMENIEAMEREAEVKRKIIEEQKRIDEQVGGVLDFLKTEEERLADSYEERRRIIVESSILAEEEKSAAVLALNEKLNEELMTMERARQSAMLTSYGTLFDSIGGLAAQFAGEQSGIARTMFAVSKAFAIADAIVKIQQGIASAAALPFPANIPAMASVAAATTGIVSTIQGTQMAGMAHDGIDSVPQTGTWLLEKGERVVTSETSAKLDRKLDMIQPGGGGGITIHAPVTVEAQPGMSAADAQRQGEAVSGAIRATIVSTLEKESRQGGLLWNLYGGGR